MAVASGGRKKLLQGLVQSLQQCVEAEAWGLRVEAAEEGQKCVQKLRQAASPGNCCFAAEEKELFLRMSHSIQQRVSRLQDLASVQETSSEDSDDMKRFKSALESLWHGSASVGDVARSLASILPQPQNSDKKMVEQSKPLPLPGDDGSMEEEKSGSLLHRSAMKPGRTYLTITIDKIGLKDPNSFVDPFVTVSIKNYFGVNLETSQDTPVATQWEVSYIVFSIPVEIQHAIEDIPRGAAIFFEFKHFNPRKRGIATHCYSFMEMDEIRPGKAFLEIYKKPPDYTRKSLCLLSIKPLYLHLTLALHNT